MLTIYHNSHDIYYRKPFGAVPCGTLLSIRLKVQSDMPVDSVKLRIWRDNAETVIEMAMEEGDIYTASFRPSKTPRLVWYYFIVEQCGQTVYYCNDAAVLGGVGEQRGDVSHSFQITVYKKGFKTPDWLKNGVIYQIFPDRFCNGNPKGAVAPKRPDYIIHKNWDDTSDYTNLDEYGQRFANDFFGGNLLGIIKKLPYLKQLGVTIIYLNPIFEAYSNHKYDTGDYTKIDPMFGDEKTFRRLCREAQKNGISVILDGVFSHTGSDSLYFNKNGNYNEMGAYQSQQSPYFDWYSFRHYPDDYECWWGTRTLPNVNELSQSYMDYIIESENSVVKRWIKAGARGWRLDVADELPDSFIQKLTAAVKSVNPDAAVIGEVWEDASNKISYGQLRSYLLGDELDSVMNYVFKDALIGFLTGGWDAGMLNQRLMSICENYPHECLYALMNLVGTHDTIRIRNVLGGCPDADAMTKQQQAEYSLSSAQLEIARKRQSMMVLFQVAFTGVPAIYYGDEAGMQGYADPFNRRTYPWGSEDAEMIAQYKAALALRHKYAALKKGSFAPVYVQGSAYAFLRIYRKKLVLAVFNAGDAPRTFELDLNIYNAGVLTDLITGEKIMKADEHFSIDCDEISARIFSVDVK